MLTPPRPDAGAATRALLPADAALAAVVSVALLITAVAGPPPGPWTVAAVGLSVAVAAAVALRRRGPATALLVLDAAVLAWFWAGLPGLLVAVGPLIGTYALAAHRGWRWGAAGAVTTALVLIVGVRVVLGDTTTVGVVPMAVLLAATAGSAGAAVGYYRALLALARAQLDRETRTREEVGRRLVAEERLRIAREVHDIVGHAMATISVQAGVALHVAEHRPHQAREALAAIRTICDEGLVDVKTALGVLRSPGDPGVGLDRLPELVGTAADAGLHVELTATGGARPLPEPVDRAAYRIVQEALTNVLRHSAARSVRLRLDHEPAALRISVRDDGPPRGADGDGHGIAGMRERARALSGRLTAAPHPDGGFEVRAELPLRDTG